MVLAQVSLTNSPCLSSPSFAGSAETRSALELNSEERGTIVFDQFDRPLRRARKGSSHRVSRDLSGRHMAPVAAGHHPRVTSKVTSKKARLLYFREVASAFCFSCSFFFHLCSCWELCAVKSSAVPRHRGGDEDLHAGRPSWPEAQAPCRKIPRYRIDLTGIVVLITASCACGASLSTGRCSDMAGTLQV